MALPWEFLLSTRFEFAPFGPVVRRETRRNLGMEDSLSEEESGKNYLVKSMNASQLMKNNVIFRLLTDILESRPFLGKMAGLRFAKLLRICKI